MSDTIIAAHVSAEEAAKLMEGLSEGEQSAVALICLTENLVDTITDIMDRTGGPQVASLFEGMIRQLGTAAVRGCAEHYSLTEDQLKSCIDHAEQVTITVSEAAHAIAIKSTLEANNETAKH